MAFGFINSIIPDADKNVTLYSSPQDTLTRGRISVSSKVTNPVRIRISIREAGASVTDLKYLEYNRHVNYGEVFETELINLGSNQTLVVRCDHPDVSFLFSGESIDESTLDLGTNVNSGLLGTIVSTDRDKKSLYQVPNAVGKTDLRADATLVICNVGTEAYRARIGLLQENQFISSFGVEDYIDYEVVILPGQTYNRPGIKLLAGESVICSSSDRSNLQFLLHGRLERGPGNNAITAKSITADYGNIGILTASSIHGNIDGTARGLVGTPDIVVGIVTATTLTGDLTGNLTGNVTGNLAGIASDSSKLGGFSPSYYLDYSHATNTPTLLSQFTNNVGYITTSFTNTNQLTNDAGFITNNVSGILTASTFESSAGLFKCSAGQTITFTTSGHSPQVAITTTGTAVFKAGLAEKYNNVGATAGTSPTHSINDGNVIKFTGNESGNNITLNITDVHNILVSGESISITAIITPNNIGNFSAVQIDGVSPGGGLKWTNGNAPSASSSGQDVYTFSILKTGTNTNDYIVYGAKTNYA